MMSAGSIDPEFAAAFDRFLDEIEERAADGEIVSMTASDAASLITG